MQAQRILDEGPDLPAAIEKLNQGGAASPRNSEIAAIGPLDRDDQARLTLELVARDFGVSEADLLDVGRSSAAIAVARQVAMYLMRVELGRQLTEVGRLMGRDRTTVTHACGHVEELREDAGFDGRIDRIEAEIRARSEDWEAGDVRCAQD